MAIVQSFPANPGNLLAENAELRAEVDRLRALRDGLLRVIEATGVPVAACLREPAPCVRRRSRPSYLRAV